MLLAKLDDSYNGGIEGTSRVRPNISSVVQQYVYTHSSGTVYVEEYHYFPISNMALRVLVSGDIHVLYT
jgi:hypothetical protein